MSSAATEVTVKRKVNPDVADIIEENKKYGFDKTKPASVLKTSLDGNRAARDGSDDTAAQTAWLATMATMYGPTGPLKDWHGYQSADVKQNVRNFKVYVYRLVKHAQEINPDGTEWDEERALHDAEFQQLQKKKMTTAENKRKREEQVGKREEQVEKWTATFGSRYDRIMRDMRSQNPMDTTMEATTPDPTITALPRPHILHREISEPTITVSATSPKNIDDPAITEDSLARSSVISTHPLATTAITPESTKALEAVSRLVISANDGSLSSLASTHNRTTTATTSDSTCTLDLNKLIVTTEQESHLSILQTTIATIPESSSTSDNSNSSDETLTHPRTSQDTTTETVTSFVTTMLPTHVEKETKKNKETTTITRTTATSCFRKVPFERHLMKLKNHERKVPVEDNLSPFPLEEIVKLKEEANKAEIIGLKKNEVDLREEIQILKTTAIQQEQRNQHDLKEIARLQDEAEKYKEENISLRTEMYTLQRELPLQDSKRDQLELKKTVKVEDTEIVNFKEQDSSQMAEIHSLKAASALQKQTHQNELEKTAGLEDEAAKSKAEILILKAEIYSLKRELQQERNRREEEIKSMQETQRMFLEYERKSSQEMMQMMMKTMMDGAESNRKRKRNDDENNTDAK